MGYYYDWFDGKWVPIDHDRKLTRSQQRLLSRRRILIDEVLAEIDSGGTVGLYARMLLRELVRSDEALMREYSKEVARLLDEKLDADLRRQEQPPDRAA